MLKVSIIVPVYNTAPYLHRCVESIINQTYQNLDIILVNDGSTDKSSEICDAFEIKDPRIRVIHKQNGGLSSARNAGIHIATGDYLGFVDSDDYIKNDMYEKLVKACIETGADISICGRFHSVNDVITAGFTLPDQVVWQSKEALKYLLTWNNIDSAAWDKLYEAKLFKDFRFPEGMLHEDVYVIPKILDRANRIVHIGEAKYYWCFRPDSITGSNFSEKQMDELISHKEVADYVIEKYPDLREKALSFYYKRLILLLESFYSKKLKSKYRVISDQLHVSVRTAFISILLNRYITFRRKMAIVLIYFNIYFFTKKLWGQCKLLLR